MDGTHGMQQREADREQQQSSCRTRKIIFQAIKPILFGKHSATNNNNITCEGSCQQKLARIRGRQSTGSALKIITKGNMAIDIIASAHYHSLHILPALAGGWRGTPLLVVLPILCS